MQVMTTPFDGRLERASPSQVPGWHTGVEMIDRCLPESGLARDGLHEVVPVRRGGQSAMAGFVLGLLAQCRARGPVVWCVGGRQGEELGLPYGPGLLRFGLSPERLVLVRARKAEDVQFVLEEAVKTDGIAAVVGEGALPCFTGSRRLSLLCREWRRPCLLLGDGPEAGKGSAALTRWQIASGRGPSDPRDPEGPGLTSWHVGLPRVRGGRVRPALTEDLLRSPSGGYPWRIVWDEETHRFCSPALVSRRAAPGPYRTRSPEALVG